LPFLNTTDLTDYRDYYTIELAEQVKNIFIKDVIRYGYKF